MPNILGRRALRSPPDFLAFHFSPMNAEKPIDFKRKLRWYQFSLRSLLTLVTLVAFVCSWFAVKMEQARKQRSAVEEIIRNGGGVVYCYGSMEFTPSEFTVPKWLNVNSHTYGVEEYPEPRLVAWLRGYLGDDFFYHVASASVTDLRQLDLTSSFEGCRHLALQGIAIDEEVLNRLEKLKQLRKLEIVDNPSKDGRVVDRLPQLMPNCRITLVTSNYSEGRVISWSSNTLSEGRDNPENK